jgi:hypothetical protein
MDERRSTYIEVLGLCFLTFAVMFWRRPDQFIHPSIWVEDGTAILRGFAERGWSSLFEPVNGYFVLSAKLISLAAFQLSVHNAPQFLLWLTVIFTCWVVLAIRFSPTYLRWPLLCAIAALLVPTDGEVFAVSLLSIWWAGLLLLLSLIWSGKDSSALRYLYLVIGGLSSPIIVPVAACSVVRAIIERRQSQFIFGAAACGIAALQVATGMNQATFSDSGPIGHIVKGAAMMGIPIMLLLLLGGRQLCRTDLDISFYLLGAVGILVWLMTLAKTGLDVSRVHPMLAGPRYFFYPYIICLWLGLWVTAIINLAVVRVLLMLAMVASVVMAVRFDTGTPYIGFRRHHTRIDWASAIEACASGEELSQLPIQFDGNPASLWYLSLQSRQCRALLAQSIF